MRRPWIVACVLVALVESRSFAVTVTFEPDPPGSNIVSHVFLPTSVDFNVVIHDIPPINGANGGLQSIDLVVGSFHTLTMEGFVYNPDFVATALLPPPVPTPIGIYLSPGSDLYFGGAQRPAVRPAGPDYLLGVLTVGVPPGIPFDVYTFQIDSLLDDFSNFVGVTEPIFALGVIFVPEPTAFASLVVAGLCLIRRRAETRDSRR